MAHMRHATIDQLIINSPYEEPREHWRYDRETRTLHAARGRRPAGYVIARSELPSRFDDPGVFVEMPLVNQIRPRVKAWREAGYPGRDRHHQAAAGALARPEDSARQPALLLLPARSHRDADLADRGPAAERQWD